VEDRRHRPARAAPRGPEVDDDRNVVALDVLVEILARERDRLASEEPLLAIAAHGLGGGAVGRCAGTKYSRAMQTQILRLSGRYRMIGFCSSRDGTGKTARFRRFRPLSSRKHA